MKRREFFGSLIGAALAQKLPAALTAKLPAAVASASGTAAKYSQATYGLGYILTSEMIEDDTYGVTRSSPYITDPEAWYIKGPQPDFLYHEGPPSTILQEHAHARPHRGPAGGLARWDEPG
jgi:hypothetical protein